MAFYNINRARDTQLTLESGDTAVIASTGSIGVETGAAITLNAGYAYSRVSVFGSVFGGTGIRSSNLVSYLTVGST